MREMRIVSDTGPIIGLAKIGRIDLLRQFTEEISIPPFVHKELFGKTGIETGLIEKALGDFTMAENNGWKLIILFYSIR